MIIALLFVAFAAVANAQVAGCPANTYCYLWNSYVNVSTCSGVNPTSSLFQFTTGAGTPVANTASQCVPNAATGSSVNILFLTTTTFTIQTFPNNNCAPVNGTNPNTLSLTCSGTPCITTCQTFSINNVSSSYTVTAGVDALLPSIALLAALLMLLF